MKELINQIDEFFYSKDQKEVMVIYALVVAVIGFIGFYFIMPNAKHYRDHEYKKYRKMSRELKQLTQEKRKLSSKIVVLNKEIKNLILEKATLKQQREYYIGLAKLLDFVIFNQKKWGDFVKNLVINAKKEGLRVDGFTNVIFDNDDKSLINKKMEISLRVSGAYKNLIYLMYRYENMKDLLRIESLKINDNKNYEIKFVLYGYEQ